MEKIVSFPEERFRNSQGFPDGVLCRAPSGMTGQEEDHDKLEMHQLRVYVSGGKAP
jgi:hypothetical protein